MNRFAYLKGEKPPYYKGCFDIGDRVRLKPEIWKRLAWKKSLFWFWQDAPYRRTIGKVIGIGFGGYLVMWEKKVPLDILYEIPFEELEWVR
jgi:hypothetical protein